ncbi:MAG: alcohol dehydrogenase catalytic domain-containing protein [Candidatus Tectimicrobiota bacterium]
MQALTYIERLRLETSYPEPDLPPGEALLKVRLAGICRTDLELTRGYMDFEGVLGHEFVAEVVEADTPPLVGQRVVGEINCPCRECPTCAEGIPNHCPDRTVLGILGRDGAFAEYTTLPEANLHPLPEGLEERTAVFAEPLAAALQVLDQVPIDEETTACVLGDGRLGLLVAQVLRTTGCRLTVLGHHEHNLDILRARGIAASLASEAPGVRYGVVVEVTGSPAGLHALDLVVPRGTVVQKTTVAGKPLLPWPRWSSTRSRSSAAGVDRWGRPWSGSQPDGWRWSRSSRPPTLLPKVSRPFNTPPARVPARSSSPWMPERPARRG